jgi:hypothetical protein
VAASIFERRRVTAVDLLIELQVAVSEHTEQHLPLTREHQGLHDGMIVYAKLSCGYLENLVIGRPATEQLARLAERHAEQPTRSAAEDADARTIAVLARNIRRLAVQVERLKIVA